MPGGSLLFALMPMSRQNATPSLLVKTLQIPSQSPTHMNLLHLLSGSFMWELRREKCHSERVSDHDLISKPRNPQSESIYPRNSKS